MMNTANPTIGNNSLASLAVDIRLHHEAVERADQSKLQHSIDAGMALNQAKEIIKQTGGSWLKWLAKEAQFSVSTANVYMRLAGNQKQIRSTAANPSIRSALKLVHDSKDMTVPPSRPKATHVVSEEHKKKIGDAARGRVKAKRRKPGSAPIKQNFIPNIPGYLEEMLLTMERCVVEYEITPVEATAKAIIAHRIKIEHFDEIIDWLTQLKQMVHEPPSEDAHEHKT